MHADASSSTNSRGPSPPPSGKPISPLLAIALSKKQEALRARSPNRDGGQVTVVTNAYAYTPQEGYSGRTQSEDSSVYGRDDAPVAHQQRTGTGMVRKKNPRPSQVLTETEGMDQVMSIALKK
jgi:hypothetical protein